MNEQQIQTYEITESEFYKWRCLVALAHADHVVTPEEKNMIEFQLRQVSLSPDQLDILNSDMEEGKNIKPLYEKVTEMKDRKHLTQLAFTLFWSDSNFDESEKKIYN